MKLHLNGAASILPLGVMDMKKLAAFIMAAAAIAIPAAAGAEAPYDVQRHWSGDVVNTFIEYGVLHLGYDDRFRPEQDITRAEACEIYADFLGVIGADALLNTKQNDDVKVELWDINPSMNGYDGIVYCVKNNMIIPNSDQSIWGDAKLTREDFAYMLNAYTSVRHPEWTAENWYYDVQDSYACIPIEKLCTAGVLSGYENYFFRPKQGVPRADFLCALYALADGWEKKKVTVTLPKSNVIDVPYISQVYPVYAPVGCEATSLLMGLKGKGYAQGVDLRTFLDELPKTSQNPAKGFVGSPYVADKTKKTRTTIYPPVLAEYGRRYGDCEDISGSSVSLVQAELLKGNPVVAYLTLWWEKPFYRWYDIEGEQQRLLSNNHALLLIGYDSETDYYYVADPYNLYQQQSEYRYWKSGDLVDRLYNERRHAVVVR